MRPKIQPIKVTALAGVIVMLLLPLALVSCANTPWYKAYGFDSREGALSIASVPVLIDALGDQNPLVRIEAAKALAEIGPDAKDAVPALIYAMKDDEYAVRAAMADALETIELKSKKVDKEETREINLLVQTVRLESKDWLMQREAVNHMIGMEHDAVDALPELIQVIEDRSNRHTHYNEVLKGAATVLGNIGPEAQTASPALIKLMENEDYDVRLEVVKALGKIGPKSGAAVIEALILAVHGDPQLIEVRHFLARLLPSKIEHLAYKGMLHGDPDCDVRREAAASLGNFEADAVAAVPALLDAALTDIDYNVRRQAAFSLCQIEPGGDSAMIALDKAIDDKKSPATRERAVLELQNAPPETRESWVPRIIACLDDIEEGVRLNAVKTLVEYRTSDDIAYKALRRVALEDKSLQVKKEAVEALRHFKNG